MRYTTHFESYYLDFNRIGSFQRVIKRLNDPSLFKPPLDTSRLLSKGIGWLSWKQLRKILEITRGHFRTEVERRFVDKLIIYLDYKIREAMRNKE